MKKILKIKLELIEKHIEIYKRNTIEAIERESMIEATSCLLLLRDLKEQQLLIKELLNKEGD